MKLSGRTAVVTGAASGLGRATAVRLAEAGARIALLDSDEQRVGALAAELGEIALPVGVDVTDPASTRRAIRAAVDWSGRVDVCVNAAGIANAGTVLADGAPLAIDDFRRVIEVNLIGTFDVMRLCAASMANNEPADGERGVIINVSSGAWNQGQRGQSAYAASKAGIVGLTLPAARDLARYGIRVVAIAPGLFDTAMAQGFSDKVRAGLERMILHPSRLGQPEEFASLVQHIVENQYFNATTVNLDGGVRMS